MGAHFCAGKTGPAGLTGVFRGATLALLLFIGLEFTGHRHRAQPTDITTAAAPRHGPRNVYIMLGALGNREDIARTRYSKLTKVRGLSWPRHLQCVRRLTVLREL